LFKKSEALSHL